MIFFAFALQCMSTVAVVRRETGSWRWPAVQFVYMGALAYGFSWLAYNLLSRMVV
jgi:ferrous iron transport protein B